MEKLLQTKLNAISAKLLHRKKKGEFESLNNFITVLTIIVPIAFLSAQFVFKGSQVEDIVNTISYVLSVILIIVAVTSLIYKVSEKILIHKLGLKENIYIINECDNLSNKTDKELEWFYRYISQIDNADNDTFSNIKDKTKRKIYREALKELLPGDISITCPNCKSSPWNYKKGDCQLCGNVMLNN